MKLIETSSDFESWCSEKGYSKNQLAQVLGITRQTIYNLTHPKLMSAAETKAPRKTQEELEKYKKIPPMLSLAIFAIEQLGIDYFGAAKRSRKPSKRRI